MKLAIISSHDSPNTYDLMQSAHSKGMECTVYALRDFALAVDTIDNNDFFSHDVYLFRGYNKRLIAAQALAKMLTWQGKKVVDNIVASNYIYSKLFEALAYRHFGLPHIPTYVAANAQAWRSLNVDLKFPVVIKEVTSSKGKGVRLCHSEEDLMSELDRYGFEILIQEFVDIAFDIRVLCVGDQVVGAIRRIAQEGDFRTNVSLGGKVEPHELSKEEKLVALSAHKKLGLNISGVDLAYDSSGKLFIIETNITPEWQGFKSATGIDVARIILDYTIKE